MIPVILRLLLGSHREQHPHALLCLARQRPPEMVVDLSDCSNGVATNRIIFYVAHAIVCQPLAFTQESVHRCGPVLDGLTADHEWIDRIAEGTAQDCYQTRNR